MDSTLATNIILSILACASIISAYMQWQSFWVTFHDRHLVAVISKLNDNILHVELSLVGDEPVFIDYVRLWVAPNYRWLNENAPQKLLHPGERVTLISYRIDADEQPFPEQVEIENLVVFSDTDRLDDVTVLYGKNTFPSSEA